MCEVKEKLKNAFAVMMLGTALLFIFGAPVINAFVAWCRSMGA